MLSHPELMLEIERLREDDPDRREERLKDRGSVLDWLDLIPDFGDEGLLLGVAVAAALVLALVLGAAVIAAPMLLAELLLDALLVAGLWRRYNRLGEPAARGGALRVIWAPALLVVLALSAAGYVLQRIDPAADSIGDVLDALRP